MPTIKINGMTCQHCVAAVTKALNDVKGVTNVSVNLESGSATYDEEGAVDVDELRAAVEEAGYSVG